MSSLEIDSGIHGVRNSKVLKWVLLGTGVLVLIGLIVFLVMHASNNNNQPGKKCVDKGKSCKSTKDCCTGLTCNNGVCDTPSKPLPPVVSQSVKSKLALSYLSAVYPIVPNVTWKGMTDKLVNDLYTSLCWYYTPLPLDVGQQSLILPFLNGRPNKKQIPTVFSRRAPLVDAYYNVSTEAFLTDGQDQVQILSPVHEGGAPGFKPDASCTASQAGFAGVMPDGSPKYFLPVMEQDNAMPSEMSTIPGWVENFDTDAGTSSTVTNWWPAYTDPNPDNPAIQNSYPFPETVCGFSDICLDGSKGGAQYIKGGTDPKTQKTLPSGSAYCFGGAAGAFASAFPSSPMGPIWNMGMKPCDLKDLDFTGTNPTNKTGQPAISSQCIANLYGLKQNGDDLRGATSDAMLEQASKANRTSAKFQMVNIIQPYGRKQGCPNFGFMEGVAYVMEGLGKKLLNAPDCSTGMSPSAVGALSRTVWCPPSSRGANMKIMDRNTKKLVPVDMVSCDPSVGKCDNAASKWKTMGSIEYYGDNPYSPEPCSGCCYSSDTNTIGNPNPQNIGTSSGVLDKKNRDAYNLAQDGNTCIQNNNVGKQCTGSKIMFYWMNGYGKFLNMGLTGVYSNYVGFLLSCPNQPWNATDPTKGPFLRRTIPQIVAMGLGGGAKTQLGIFTGGGNSYMKDPREYLSGYVTTFQHGAPMGKTSSLQPSNYSTVLGKTVPYKYDFEATEDDYNKCVIIVSGRMLFAKTWGPHVLPNKTNASIYKNGQVDFSNLCQTQKNNWYPKKFASMGLPADMQTPPGLGNSQGLLNPQEGIAEYLSSGKVTGGDALLCQIAANTVQCYYPPGLGIRNPNHNKPLKLTPDEGAVLWGAMYVMGDTGADWMGYNKGPATCAQVSKPTQCPSWPFGTYYFAANIGGCVYGLTAALGWNSSQFSVMSTGGGGSKACDYPNYDYEIVYVGGSGLKNQVCQNSVKITTGGKTSYEDDVYGFKMLDISGGSQLSLLNYYTQENYVQGSTKGLTDDINDQIACIDNGKGPVWASEERVNAFRKLFASFNDRYNLDYSRYHQQPFSACTMPLSEMNVHTGVWGKTQRPNSLFYAEPKGKCEVVSGNTPEERAKSLAAYLECEKKGGVGKTWPFGLEKSGASDCPYEDGKFGMRTEATNNNVNQLWAHNVNQSHGGSGKHHYYPHHDRNHHY